MPKYRAYIQRVEDDYIEFEADDEDDAWDRAAELCPSGWELEEIEPIVVEEKPDASN